ncbi:hypothetical protein OEZ85_005803 [Tetradesmus obliquus]|uniref:Uncharacterized protein n=1 Tax=Tetradesmus obliquus TaxID=3088 RepID=A0ABY8UFH3_TETOB|nr:hypothetical protein OEZ85_005803 [Tetradesmus obliquus]
MNENNTKAQEQRAVAAHVDGKLLHSEQDEGSLRVSDKSAFKKFKNAAKRIIVTREVLDILHGASHNLSQAQKEYEAGQLLPRLLGTLRAAPPAVAARLSPEASPRPYQPGLSLDAAARAAAESWQLIELVEEGAVDQAEAGWRELLAEKRAKLRGRVTELDIKHAAARMIQATWRLHRHRLIKDAMQKLDERLGTPRSCSSSSSFDPFSTAVGRDGLAIKTAMPSASKAKWKVAAKTAIAAGAFAQAGFEGASEQQQSVEGDQPEQGQLSDRSQQDEHDAAAAAAAAAAVDGQLSGMSSMQSDLSPQLSCQASGLSGQEFEDVEVCGGCAVRTAGPTAAPEACHG